jgi:GDP-L-fucose synthase
MAGSAIVRNLRARGYTNLITKTRAELDLTDQAEVCRFFAIERIEEIYLAAAKVGGIYANNEYPAEFIYENIMIEANVIHAAFASNIKRLLFLGSSCIYPRECPQPIKEEYLLTGTLEATNEPYAIAKIAGLKLCEAYNRQYGTEYVAIMPTNLYGPNDNYNLENSHVLPALLRKVHDAKARGERKLVVWGSGKPKREFLHVDDLASAGVFLMEKKIRGGVFNVGAGVDLSIRELADLIMQQLEFEGEIVFDASKPDGTPRKLLDISKMTSLGWAAKIDLAQGIKLVHEDFCSRYSNSGQMVES